MSWWLKLWLTGFRILGWFLPESATLTKFAQRRSEMPIIPSSFTYWFSPTKKSVSLALIYLFVLIHGFVLDPFFYYRYWFSRSNCPRFGQWEPPEAGSCAWWHVPIIVTHPYFGVLKSPPRELFCAWALEVSGHFSMLLVWECPCLQSLAKSDFFCLTFAKLLGEK